MKPDLEFRPKLWKGIAPRPAKGGSKGTRAPAKSSTKPKRKRGGTPTKAATVERTNATSAPVGMSVTAAVDASASDALAKLEHIKAVNRARQQRYRDKQKEK